MQKFCARSQTLYQGETLKRRAVRCGKCGLLGHNRLNCVRRWKNNEYGNNEVEEQQQGPQPEPPTNPLEAYYLEVGIQESFDDRMERQQQQQNVNAV